jgi:excisionase family DNA binding protein
MRVGTVHDVAVLLRVSKKTVYQWAELRVLPSMKLSGSLRFDLDDVESWIRQCKRENDSCYNPFAQTTNSPRKGGRN